MTQQSDSKTKASFERIGRKLDEEFGDAAEKLERESERVIAYLNNEVVPSIRNHSSKALCVAAEKLSWLAEYMDNNRSK
jgi:bisphosphoglycerate-dependent phosphoglycerate mutase